VSLSAEVFFSIVAVETDTADIARNSRVTRADYFQALTEGTAANQAQIVWSDSRVSGGTDTLQLNNLSDTRDGASVSVVFSAVKAIYVRNTSASTLALSFSIVGVGQACNVSAGGVFCLVDPTSIGSLISTLVVASAVGATYDIVLIGEGTIV
jgi:hypothetical protein